MLSRRELIASLAFARLAPAAASSGSLGVQLYSVRRMLKSDPDGTLQALAGIGYKEVEGYNRLETIALAPRIKQAGFTLRSCRTETPLITADWENYPELKQVSLKEAVDSLSAARVEFFVMGYISPGARGDADDFYRRTADRMNVAGELCRKSGLKFAWQNHAFEFRGQPGKRPIDLIKGRLEPGLVRLELDLFWASLAGQDPLQLLKDWKGRVSLVHLNDRAKDAPVQFSEAVGLGAYAEPGTGALDFSSILKAARAAGVSYYFAGSEETEGDPLESLRRSFGYLKNL